MAYTDPVTHAAGDLFPSADWNTYIRDNFRYLHDKAADVVAAGAMAAPLGGFYSVTGNTQINTIGILSAGTPLDLLFTGTPIVTHTAIGGATGTLVLSSGANYTAVVGDVLRFRSDGTQWRQAGVSSSQGLPAVATTVAGLGAATNGKVGFLRVGATPYDFVKVIYDATYGKWVSDEWLVAQFARAVATGAADTIMNDPVSVGFPNDYVVHKPFTDAGLTLQLRAAGYFANSAGTVTIKLAGYPQNDADTALGSGTAVTLASGVGMTTPTIKDYGWQSMAPGTPKTLLAVALLANGSAGTATMEGSVLGRWIA